jgi:hypothetical protein
MGLDKINALFTKNIFILSRLLFYYQALNIVEHAAVLTAFVVFWYWFSSNFTWTALNSKQGISVAKNKADYKLRYYFLPVRILQHHPVYKKYFFLVSGFVLGFATRSFYLGKNCKSTNATTIPDQSQSTRAVKKVECSPYRTRTGCILETVSANGY